MPIGNSVCNARHINHICLVVSNIEEALEFYGETFGITANEIVDIKDQGVRAALVEVGGSQIEFIESTDPQNGVARFLENKGEGVHHICFEVEDLRGTLDRLNENGVQLIDESPREGLSGEIAFIHPKSSRGVLIELVDQDTTGR